MKVRHFTKILTIMSAFALAMPLLLTGCGGKDSVNLDSIYNANTTASLLQQHSSVYEDFSYYENLDDQVTFKTTYCYSQESGGQAVYQAEGYDAQNETSDDNFSYCIVDNVEYFVNYAQEMAVYPLNEQYIDDFKSSSFTVSIDEDETLESVKKDGSSFIVTTTASASDLYSEDTISSLTGLAGESITGVKKVYTVDRDTLLLSGLSTYYTGNSDKEYLFSTETVTYDDAQPDVGFAEAYINPDKTRTVTVIEKTSGGDISNVYTLPADVSPNFDCFTSSYGYTICNDPDGNDPFVSETPDASGSYANVTLYAIPANEEVDADISSSGQ